MDRIHSIVDSISEEALTDRPGRQLVLERLLEALFVEALRFRPMFAKRRQRGIVVGLSDPSVARALLKIHSDVARDWTIAELAQAAGLSRAQFAEEFARNVGLPPLQYLVQWRLAVARDILAHERLPIAEVAGRVGYQSASGFCTAFARVVGCSPREFARLAR